MLTPENIAVVAGTVREVPSTSIHRCPQQLNISDTPLALILHTDLGMTPYKEQLVHELKPIDHLMRFRFVNWACKRLTGNGDFGKKKKSSFQLKLILILASILTRKVVAFGVQ